jgi:hypothetical protein
MMKQRDKIKNNAIKNAGDGLITDPIVTESMIHKCSDKTHTNKHYNLDKKGAKMESYP